MDEILHRHRRSDAVRCHGLAQPSARFAELDSAQSDAADGELLAHELGQPNAASDEIPARAGEPVSSAEVRVEGFDDLRLDERDVLPGLVLGPEVAIAVDAGTRDNPHVRNLGERATGFGRNENALDIHGSLRCRFSG